MMKKLKELIKFFMPIRYKETKIIRYHRISKSLRLKKLNYLAEFFENKIYKKYNCIISSKATIGKNITFPHPLGIVIGEGAVIGNNVTIYQNVTIGRKDKDIPEYPQIKDNCVIYCNSVLLGGITINRGTIIGANSVLLKDTEENSIYVGIPAKRKVGGKNI